jgi:L-ascorbate metabolism protein UlaG (beta-lactamase superfamily)
VQEGKEVIYTGNPCGFVISAEGKNIYFAGDTGLFGDMRLIGEVDALDVALLPIGGNFTMDAADALRAVEMLKPKLTIPMHYDTWEVIRADAEAFVRECKAKSFNATTLKINEPYSI